jgi:hypothetical protein
MATYYGPIDILGNELRNARTQNLGTAPSTPGTGRRYFDTGLKYERYYDGTRWVNITDTWTLPTASVDMNGQRIINLGTPTGPSDAATKAYADSVATGLDVKDAVRVASTANINTAAPGAAIDGVTLANGDRVLLKNQTTASQNGIYVFNGAAAAMTRSTDADTSAKVTSGLFVLTVAGSTLSGTGWILTTPDPIVLNTTALTFAQFSASTTYTGTTNRVTVTGTVIDIAATYTGQTSITTLGSVTTGTWQGTTIGVFYGGTGATSASQARSNLGVPGKYAETITGDGTTTAFTITHNLATNFLSVAVFEVAGGAQVYPDVVRLSTSAVRLDFSPAPANAAGFDVVVIG